MQASTHLASMVNVFGADLIASWLARTREGNNNTFLSFIAVVNSFKIDPKYPVKGFEKLKEQLARESLEEPQSEAKHSDLMRQWRVHVNRIESCAVLRIQFVFICVSIENLIL
jgi:hypothetical protein